MVVPVVAVLAVLIFYPSGSTAIWLTFTDQTEANQLVRDLHQVDHRCGEVCKENPNVLVWFVGLDNYVNVLTGKIGEFWPQWTGTTLIWTAAGVTFHDGPRSRPGHHDPPRDAVLFSLVLPCPAGPCRGRCRRSSAPSPGSSSSTSGWGSGQLLSAQRDRHRLGRLVRRQVDCRCSPCRHQRLARRAVHDGGPARRLAVIPYELYESAEIDGATAWQRFRHVTLPGLRPVSTTVILLSTIWTFNMFPMIFLVTHGRRPERPRSW